MTADSATTQAAGSTPQGEAPPHRVVISDPQAVRALAHRARIEVLDELYASQGSRTATELAANSNLTPSAMSYHLRALEKYGLVERAESQGDARERRWKATGGTLVVSPLGESKAGMSAYVDMQFAQYREHVASEISYRQDARAAGQKIEGTYLASGALYLDEESQKEFFSRIQDVVDEFEARSSDDYRGGVEGKRTYYLLSAVPDRKQA